MAGPVNPNARRARQAWPDEMCPDPPATTDHACEMPAYVRLGMAGMAAAMLLLSVAVALMAVYVYQADQYVQGRGEYRDAEAVRIEQKAAERSRRATCDLLDQLPAAAVLDRVRGKYECGPGIPADQYPPTVQPEEGVDP